MKTIGLIGGVSWHSTLDYYRRMNEIANQKLGGHHSAKMLVYSFDFQEIRDLHATSEALLCKRLQKEALALENAGADCLLIGANTLHLFYDEVQSVLDIPVLHIADAVGKTIYGRGLKKVALLGTAVTMEKRFYQERLQLSGVQAIVPDKQECKTINDIIYKELVKGIIQEESKDKYITIINRLIKEESVEGIILGCTEIPLLIKENDVPVPIFDSLEIHANEAVEFALGE